MNGHADTAVEGGPRRPLVLLAIATVTSRTLGDFSTDMLEQFAHYAQEQGTVTPQEAKAWLDDLNAKGKDGSYFFCVNRFIFSAVKI
jgi:hypothetical protein